MSRRAEIRRSEAPAGGGARPNAALTRAAGDRTQQLGRTLVSQFYMVTKTAGMFDFANVITREAVVTFLGTVRELTELDGRVALTIASDCIFVNETRLKIDFEGFISFKFVIESMKGRGIGTITFGSGFDRADLETFLRLFLKYDSRVENARQQIDVGLGEAGIDSVQTEECRDLAEDVTRSDASGENREVSIQTYFKSIFVAKQFIENFRGPRSGGIRKAKRLVHSIVDLVAEDESTLLALTQIKNFDNFLFTHSANVCVLAVALGQTLGLDKPILANLGLAALLHDIGMTEIPRDVLSRTGPWSATAREMYERHPVIGARAILRSQGVSGGAIRCLLVSLEHHLHEDGTGFPATARAPNRTLLGRIVGLVDFYDTVTTPDGQQRAALSPEETLRLLANQKGDIFDPALVKVFINTVGAHPLGSVVRLDTGEVAIVHRKSHQLSQQDRPFVRIIADEYGAEVDQQIVDLGEWDAEHQRYHRTIVETIPPSLYFDGVRQFTDFV